MESLNQHNSPEKDSAFNEDDNDELFIEIIYKIKSGETVWLPRMEDPDTIDLFKNKKYQGCIRLEDVQNSLYMAYKADPKHLGVDQACVTPKPVAFQLAANIILDLVAPE